MATRFAFIIENSGAYGVRRLAAALKAGASSRTPKLRFLHKKSFLKNKILGDSSTSFFYRVVVLTDEPALAKFLCAKAGFT